MIHDLSDNVNYEQQRTRKQIDRLFHTGRQSHQIIAVRQNNQSSQWVIAPISCVSGIELWRSSRVESKNDFVHKLGVVLKELRESLNCPRILAGTNYIKTESPAMKECNELVSIFVKSVETNKKKMEEEEKQKSNKKSQI